MKAKNRVEKENKFCFNFDNCRIGNLIKIPHKIFHWSHNQ